MAGGVVVAALCLAPGPAFADHAKDANAGDPDNAHHYLDRNSLTYYGDLAAVHGRDQLDRSDMNATFSGSGDVEIEDGDYDQNSWSGQTSCQSGYNWLNGNCDVFLVRFDTAIMAGQGATAWRHLGCHELGHTAGLGHRTSSNDTDDNSCLRQGLWNATSLDRHDLDAINSSV